ncbi:MAG: TSUP family transporter [Bacteroidetes bacterium]|nr:TSUP family transporter [Bacteroidota bacterium]
MELYQIIIAIVGGFLAGVINTLAGNGSAITLSILTEVMGLPGNVANGTNRIGIAFQTFISSYTFHKGGVLRIENQWRPIALVTLGAILGIGTAVYVSNDQFMFVFKYLVLLMFLLLLIHPRRWIAVEPEGKSWPKPILYGGLLLLGFYGGFIQMGMGLFFLAIAVLGARYTLLQANALKVMVVALYTLFAIVIFAWQGRVDWTIGLTLGVGQLFGGWITTRYAVRYPSINKVAYVLLLVAVGLAILSLFDVL